jgi:hypothetical protein
MDYMACTHGNWYDFWCNKVESVNRYSFTFYHSQIIQFIPGK